jgi:hypothetical protein
MKKASLTLRAVLAGATVAAGLFASAATASAAPANANTGPASVSVDSVIHQLIAGSGLANTGSSLQCPFYVERPC